MDCIEIRDAFVSGGVPSGAEVDEHLRACPPCRELLESDARLGAALAPAGVALGAELLSRVEGAIARERGPRAWLRSRPSRVRIALATALATLILLAHLVVWPRQELRAGDLVRWAAVLILFSVGLFVGVRGAMHVLGRQQLRLAWALVVVLLPVLLSLLPEWQAGRGTVSANGFLSGSLMCLSYGILMSGPLTLLLWFASREDRLPTVTLLFAAGASGLAANLALHAHCPVTFPAHLLVGHATVGLVWLLGLWLVNRLVPVR